MRPTVAPSVADVLNTAADEVDRWPAHTSHYNLRTGAGGSVFGLLFETAKQLYGWTAIQALERHLGNQLPHGQIQHWRETDQAAVSAALRSAAAAPIAEDTEVAALRAKLSDLHQRLAAAVGWPGIDQVDVLVHEVAGRIKTLEQQRDTLQKQLDAAA